MAARKAAKRVAKVATPKQKVAQRKWQEAGAAARRGKRIAKAAVPKKAAVTAGVVSDKKKSDTITLYHTTNVANAKRILAEGFKWGSGQSGTGARGAGGLAGSTGPGSMRYGGVKEPIWFSRVGTYGTADYLNYRRGDTVILKVEGVPRHLVQYDQNEEVDASSKADPYWRVVPLSAVKGLKVTKYKGKLEATPEEIDPSHLKEQELSAALFERRGNVKEINARYARIAKLPKKEREAALRRTAKNIQRKNAAAAAKRDAELAKYRKAYTEGLIAKANAAARRYNLPRVSATATNSDVKKWAQANKIGIPGVNAPTQSYRGVNGVSRAWIDEPAFKRGEKRPSVPDSLLQAKPKKAKPRKVTKGPVRAAVRRGRSG